jgi:GT2 family glycosyltransferase
MTFDAIIPVYNTQLSEVPAVRSFIGCKSVTVFVCDNSTNEGVKRANSVYAASWQEGLVYIDMGGNRGLSCAYNAAVDAGFGDVVCIFDDDTTPPEGYIEAISAAVGEGGSGCYVPLVKSGTTLLSPLRRIGPAIMRTKDPMEIPSERIFAFNTGMAVTRDVFRMVSYDESLFLDYVDHAFCRDLHSKDVPVRVVDGLELQQDYSRETNNLDSALRRDMTFRRDVRTYHRRSFFESLYAEVYLSYRLVWNTLKYKTTSFLTLMGRGNSRG